MSALLISLGADVDARDSSGKTVLDYAYDDKTKDSITLAQAQRDQMRAEAHRLEVPQNTQKHTSKTNKKTEKKQQGGQGARQEDAGRGEAEDAGGA